MTASKFIEILDDNSADTTAQQHSMSDSDVRLEDVLADQEHQQQRRRSRSRSSTLSFSSRRSRDDEYCPRTSTSRDGESSPPSSSSSSSPTSPVPRIKRLRKFTLTGGFSR